MTHAKETAQIALDWLQEAIDKLADGKPLNAVDRNRLRAAASHFGRECAAECGLQWEGETAAKHDKFDWRDALVYIADPF